MKREVFGCVKGGWKGCKGCKWLQVQPSSFLFSPFLAFLLTLFPHFLFPDFGLLIVCVFVQGWKGLSIGMRVEASSWLGRKKESYGLVVVFSRKTAEAAHLWLEEEAREDLEKLDCSFYISPYMCNYCYQ